MSFPGWCCPQDGRELELQANSLKCPEGHSFAVVDQIPRFVEASNYATHFGAQWKKYRLTQLDSYTKLPITRDRVARCIGSSLWGSLEGRQVLECGCGAGRFTELLLDQKAQVTSIDLSSAVEANAQTFPVSAQHRIAQADIRQLPFPPKSFDLVFCLGVVQHTPDPEETIRCLYEKVAPGGLLVIDHYRFDWGWYTRTAPLFRMVLKRIPPPLALKFTSALVKTMIPIHRWATDKGILWSIVSRISPLLTYYRMLPELDQQQQIDWAILDTHDSLTDWYKHFRTPEQIRSYLQELGLEEIWENSTKGIVEARGRRPR